jgi:hypothetical protein
VKATLLQATGGFLNFFIENYKFCKQIGYRPLQSHYLLLLTHRQYHFNADISAMYGPLILYFLLASFHHTVENVIKAMRSTNLKPLLCGAQLEFKR